MAGYPRVNSADGSGLDGVEIVAEPSFFGLNAYAAAAHGANRQWWKDPITGEPIERNKGELIALMHSELSEALEGIRKGLPDDHLPHRSGEEVELVDLLIRVFDYAGGFGLDLQGAFEEKMAYNARRADHTAAGRLADGGKRF
jgi:NTP pyrophosphatase (non-canonical NTP hydrolase)